MKQAKVNGMDTTSSLPATKEKTALMPSLEVDMYKMEITAQQIRQYIAPADATSEDIAFFLAMSKSLGLNPFANEVYLIPFRGKDGRKYAPVVNYQVLLDRADASGVLDGIEMEFDDEENPTRITVTIHRKDWKIPFKRTTLLSEAMRTKQDGSPMALWATRLKQMLEKCGVTAALRMAIPACRRMPYIAEELQSDPSGYIEQTVTPELTKAEVVGAEVIPDSDADRDYLRGQYFKLTNEFFSDEYARHKWQKAMHKDGVLSSDSAKTMTADDFTQAYSLIEEYIQDIQDGSTDNAPESTQDGQDGSEVEMESAEAVEGTLDAEVSAKQALVIDLIADTPLKSIDTPGFTTWWHQLLPDEADKEFGELGVLDLDIIIAAIEARIDQSVDDAAQDGDLF